VTKTRTRSRSSQQGAATIAVAFLILVILAAALASSLSMSGTAIRDAASSEEQVAALFLAESGLERGQQFLAAGSGGYTNATCTGLSGGPYSLGRGTITLTGASTPASCSGNDCVACLITSVGRIGSVSRTITLNESLGSANGVACDSTKRNCTTATLTLKNPSTTTQAVAIFNLAARRQGQNTAVACDVSGGGSCRTQWNVNSSNGSPSVGGLGVAVTVPAGGAWTVTSTLDASRNWVKVGGFFQGTSNPQIVGGTTTASSYWNDASGGGGSQANTSVSNNSTGVGSTNNGAANTVSTGCVASPTGAGTRQGGTGSASTCTSWCVGPGGADTLVMGFLGRTSSDSLSEGLSTVHFNTTQQNVELNQLVKFPNPAISDAPGDVYSEIWFKRNPYYASSPAVASSYKGVGTGAIGATFTGSVAGTVLTVTVAPLPGTIITPDFVNGDTLSGSGVVGNPMITSQVLPLLAGESLGGRGRYNISDSQSGSSGAMVATSKTLNLTDCTICFFAAADALSVTGNPAIISQASGTAGGEGTYLLSAYQAAVVPSSPLTAGIPGNTIYLPSSSSMPTVTTPETMIIAVSSPQATGKFAPQTRVTAITSPAPNVATNSFTISGEPTTPLKGATICGGACAFFDHTLDATDNSKQRFEITYKTGNTAQWAAGFVCLSGVDIEPTPIESVKASPRKWSEIVN
jgi:hypothetical protein